MIGTKVKAGGAQDTMLQGLTTGGAAGTLRIFSGTVPADLTVTPTGTQLVSMTAGSAANNAFAITNATTLVAACNNLPWSAVASASGTASFFRFYDSTGAARLQGSVSVTGGGGELQLSSLTITAGGTVTVSTFQSTISGIT